MKKLYMKTFLITMLLVTFCSSIVYASPPHNQHHVSPTHHLINIINFFTDLELTPQQKSAFRELLTDTHHEIKPLIEEMHGLRTEMDELLLEEEIDGAVVEKRSWISRR